MHLILLILAKRISNLKRPKQRKKEKKTVRASLNTTRRWTSLIQSPIQLLKSTRANEVEEEIIEETEEEDEEIEVVIEVEVGMTSVTLNIVEKEEAIEVTVVGMTEETMTAVSEVATEAEADTTTIVVAVVGAKVLVKTQTSPGSQSTQTASKTPMLLFINQGRVRIKKLTPMILTPSSLTPR